MAKFETRGQTAGRLPNHLVLFVSLLVLCYSRNSLAWDINLDKFKDKFEATLKESVMFEKDEQIIYETISMLLEEARSVTNHKQLTKFKQILEDLVNETDRQMIKEKNRITPMIEELNSKIDELYPKVQRLRSLSNGDPSVEKLVEENIKKCRTFLTLKSKLLTGDAKNVEKHFLKMLRSLPEHKDEL